MVYIVFIKDGHHHQLMKVERIKYKKKKEQRKENKSKQEALATFGEWVSDDEESSTNHVQAQVMSQ